MYLEDTFLPRKALEIIIKDKITMFIGVPFMFDIMNKLNLEKIKLNSLRLCISSGAALSKEIFYKFKAKYGVNIIQQYGLTETGCVSINYPFNSKKIESVGKPLDHVKVKIVNENTEGIGEVVIKSSATGKYVDKKYNKERFKKGWLYTQDIGRMDEDGYLYILGRKSNIINVAGLKVSAEEVENIISKHPAVKEVVVIGVKKNFGEAVKAVVILKTRISKLDLIKYCKSRLEEYKIPRVVEFSDSLPKSPTGKILRRFLIDE